MREFDQTVFYLSYKGKKVFPLTLAFLPCVHSVSPDSHQEDMIRMPFEG